MIGFAYNNTGTISNCNILGTESENLEMINLLVCGITLNNSGTIENCSLEYVKINSTAPEGWIGGICGGSSGTIKDCIIKNSVIIGYDKVGGIVGNTNGAVNNCRVEDSSFGRDFESSTYEIGGIVGETTSGATIKNCSVSNPSIYKGLNFGFVVGNNKGNIENCYSEGSFSIYNIEGSMTTQTLGGIVGKNHGIILRCYSTINIDSNCIRATYLGGIAGINTGTITYCYNKGELYPLNIVEYIGGIVGENTGTLNCCYNRGNIGVRQGSAKSIGGIAGTSSKSITYCYTTGNITKTPADTAAYTIAEFTSGTDTQCYYFSNASYSSGVTKNGTGAGVLELKTIVGINYTWEDCYEIDYSGLNNGYPVCQWEANDAGKTVSSGTLYYKATGVISPSTSYGTSGVCQSIEGSSGTAYVYVPIREPNNNNSTNTFTISKSGQYASVSLKTNGSTISSNPYEVKFNRSGVFRLISGTGGTVNLTTPYGYGASIAIP